MGPIRGTLSWAAMVAACLFLLPGCGKEETPAIALPDPLHTGPPKLPPPEMGLPPAPVHSLEAPELIAVPNPPFTEGVFPCSRCHIGGAPVVDTLPAMPHKKHLDRELLCADCHGEGDPKIPEAKTCFECHEKLAEEPEPVRNYFASIAAGEGSWKFPRRWDTRDVRPNHAGHAKAKVDCTVCHGQPADTPFGKPKAVALMHTCQECHAERKVANECKTCHEQPMTSAHPQIQLHHAEDQRGCLDCHSREDRDRLHLVNGEMVAFEESYRLCGQCHGPTLRDWKAGVHGKRTGMWNGEKQYLLCAHCHNPHSPKFQPLPPLPPPLRPEEIR